MKPVSTIRLTITRVSNTEYHFQASDTTILLIREKSLWRAFSTGPTTIGKPQTSFLTKFDEVIDYLS